MPPIVSIVGLSNVGKTTLLERLVSELKKRSYKVATIKHDVHGFDMDKPGKDSWRLAQAGSDIVIVSSPEKLAMIKKVDHDSTVRELAQLVGNSVDIILTEGFKQGEAPKIEVHRKAAGSGLLCKPVEMVALVSDEPLDLPVWQCPLDDISGLADFVERTFLTDQKAEITLLVNGVSVSMKPYVRDSITNTLVGMVSALKGLGEIESLEVSLKRNLPWDK